METPPSPKMGPPPTVGTTLMWGSTPKRRTFPTIKATPPPSPQHMGCCGLSFPPPPSQLQEDPPPRNGDPPPAPQQTTTTQPRDAAMCLILPQ